MAEKDEEQMLVLVNDLSYHLGRYISARKGEGQGVWVQTEPRLIEPGLKKLKSKLSRFESKEKWEEELIERLVTKCKDELIEIIRADAGFVDTWAKIEKIIGPLKGQVQTAIEAQTKERDFAYEWGIVHDELVKLEPLLKDEVGFEKARKALIAHLQGVLEHMKRETR